MSALCVMAGCMSVRRYDICSRVFDEQGRAVSSACLLYNQGVGVRFAHNDGCRTSGVGLHADAKGFLRGEVDERRTKNNGWCAVERSRWDGTIDAFVAAPGYAPVRYVGQKEVLMLREVEFSDIMATPQKQARQKLSKSYPLWVSFRGDGENRRIRVEEKFMSLGDMSDDERNWIKDKIKKSLGDGNRFVKYGAEYVVVYVLDCSGLNMAQKIWADGEVSRIPYSEMRNYLPVEKRHRGERVRRPRIEGLWDLRDGLNPK